MKFEASNQWYINAAESETDIPELSAGMFLEECSNCNGDGEMPRQQVFVGCPCCKGSEKIRNCRECHGKGFK